MKIFLMNDFRESFQGIADYSQVNMTKGRYGKFGPGVGKQDSSQIRLISYNMSYQDSALQK
ncbi:MAG TPA: hypothetical protein VF008_06135 [Niastella sp.]